MINIAIDGPAGAGKSTIAKLVAKATGSIYVDTGAMYRAMALYFIQNGIQADQTDKINASLDDIDISITYIDDVQHVLLNGEDVTDRLRDEAVGNMASAVSVNENVRAKLVALQQKLAKTTQVVMDGRDIGTVVLPDAAVKIYLTASAHTRAMRRYKEIAERDLAEGKEPLSPLEEALDIERIEKDIIERDDRDMHREHSPLTKAADAVEIDSSDLTIDDVVIQILDLADSAALVTKPIVYSKS